MPGRLSIIEVAHMTEDQKYGVCASIHVRMPGIQGSEMFEDCSLLYFADSDYTCSILDGEGMMRMIRSGRRPAVPGGPSGPPRDPLSPLPEPSAPASSERFPEFSLAPGAAAFGGDPPPAPGRSRSPPKGGWGWGRAR